MNLQKLGILALFLLTASHSSWANPISAECVEKITGNSVTTTTSIFSGIIPNGGIVLRSSLRLPLVFYVVSVIDPSRPAAIYASLDGKNTEDPRPLSDQDIQRFFSNPPFVSENTSRITLQAQPIFPIGIQNNLNTVDVSFQNQSSIQVDLDFQILVWGQPDMSISCTFEQGISVRPCSGPYCLRKRQH